MKKKVVLIVVFILIGLFIIINIFSFAKDKSNSKKAMDIIKNDYNKFWSDAKSFGEKRDYIYDNIFGSDYAENFKNNYKYYYDYFDSYKVNVNKIKKDSKNLDKYCNGIYYTKKSINTKCQTFIENYELVINYYVLDVKRFNVIIDEYNNYLEKENLKEKKLSKYNSQYKYIDYNKDGKMSGKE